MSGSEILRSERTGTEREISGSFHTLMARTSSAPILYVSSCSFTALASASAAAGGLAIARLLWSFADCDQRGADEMVNATSNTHLRRKLPSFLIAASVRLLLVR